MTKFKILKNQAKRTLPEVTRFSVMRLRSRLGFSGTITMLDCKQIVQELHPLTKRQREIFEGFENGWHYAGSQQCTHHDILLRLVKKGYLRTKDNNSEFKRIIPLAETEVE